MKNLWPLMVASAILAGCSKPAEQPAESNSKPAPKPEVQKSAGELTPTSLSEKMEVPIYPGSEAPDRMTRPPVDDKQGGTRYELVLATKDPVEKVCTFYVDKLHLDALKQDNGKQLIGRTPKGNDLLIMVGTEAGRTMIRIKAIVYKKPS